MEKFKLKFLNKFLYNESILFSYFETIEHRAQPNLGLPALLLCAYVFFVKPPFAAEPLC